MKVKTIKGSIDCHLSGESIEKLKAEFQFPLEDIELEGTKVKRRFRFKLGIKCSEEIRRIVDAFEKGFICNGVWVSPGLPLLVFITAGLIIALTFGDLVLAVIMSLGALLFPSHHVIICFKNIANFNYTHIVAMFH